MSFLCSRLALEPPALRFRARDLLAFTLTSHLTTKFPHTCALPPLPVLQVSWKECSIRTTEETELPYSMPHRNVSPQVCPACPVCLLCPVCPVCLVCNALAPLFHSQDLRDSNKLSQQVPVVRQQFFTVHL